MACLGAYVPVAAKDNVLVAAALVFSSLSSLRKLVQFTALDQLLNPSRDQVRHLAQQQLQEQEQMNAFQACVTELRNASQGSAQNCAEYMAKLVTETASRSRSDRRNRHGCKHRVIGESFGDKEHRHETKHEQQVSDEGNQ